MSDLETRALKLGKERYHASIRKAVEHGRESHTPAGRYLMRECVARVSEALTEWTANMPITARRSGTTWPYLTRIKPEVAALIGCKAVLDHISGNHTYQTLALYIGGRLEDECRMVSLQAEAGEQFRQVMKRFEKTGRRNLRLQIKKAAAIHAISFDAWPRKIKYHAGALLIEMILKETGIIDIDRRPSRKGSPSHWIVPNADTVAWLQASHEHHEALHPFFMPIDKPPATWEDLYDGGYHSNLLRRHGLVRHLHGPQRRLVEVADMEPVYEAVNTLQQTAWRLNGGVLDVLQELHGNGSTLGSLPLPSDEQLPERPSDYKENPEAAKEYRRQSRIIRDRNREHQGKRLALSKSLMIARELGDRVFYYPQTLDFRGRVYPQPVFLQPQGDSISRALLRFAHGKPIETEDQLRWFRIHGANKYGLDKVPYAERVTWVSQMEGDILRWGTQPLDYKGWAKADKPWEFLAWCMEYAGFLEEGYGFVSSIPVAMDGSNNGLQIFSLLLRDPVGGLATNVIPSNTPQDIYQQVADRVTEKLEASDEVFAKDWLRYIGRVPRSFCKRPVMTLPYGSTRYSCHRYMMDAFLTFRRQNQDIEVPWPRDWYTPCYRLSQFVWDAIGEVVVAARAAMTWLREASAVLSKEGVAAQWTTPLGFPVYQHYTKYSKGRIKSAYGDTVRNLHLRTDTHEIDPRSQCNGLAPNFIHSLDATALFMTVNKAKAHGLDSFAMVHDSYGVLAADAPQMSADLREAYAELFTGDLLGDLKEQLGSLIEDPSKLPDLPAYGDLDVQSLRSSEYFFA